MTFWLQSQDVTMTQGMWCAYFKIGHIHNVSYTQNFCSVVHQHTILIKKKLARINDIWKWDPCTAQMYKSDCTQVLSMWHMDKIVYG